MRIRKVRKITYLTILDTSLGSVYQNQSFEAVYNQQKEIIGIKDWISGGIIDIEDIPNYSLGEGWDIVMFNSSYTNSVIEYATQLLQQKLSIQLGELQYNYERTSDIGVPYIDKKSKEELDLLLQNQISNTETVKEILEFNSTLQNRQYHCDFKVMIEGGNTLWLSTER
jgi:hypothetical protein